MYAGQHHSYVFSPLRTTPVTHDMVAGKVEVPNYCTACVLPTKDGDHDSNEDVANITAATLYQSHTELKLYTA